MEDQNPRLADAAWRLMQGEAESSCDFHPCQTKRQVRGIWLSRPGSLISPIFIILQTSQLIEFTEEVIGPYAGLK